jgi:hypothetical protein
MPVVIPSQDFDMLDNPYQPPRHSEIPVCRAKRLAMLKYLITSAVLGTLAGTSAVFAFPFFKSRSNLGTAIVQR